MKTALLITSITLCWLACVTFCWFHFFKPDPENKRKFKKTLGVELTSDVKDIHYYNDFFPTDYAIFLAFTCDSSTIMRIVREKGLKLTSKGMGGLSCPFDWWDQEKLYTIDPYKKLRKKIESISICGMTKRIGKPIIKNLAHKIYLKHITVRCIVRCFYNQSVYSNI